ncbi:MAG: hypothetical protein WAP03_19325 [Methylorubrum rhodinum]|uniref:phage adaptor protein n=1 Tax=Methylorubrum rhodinum TaxID=29428 RepID=UPI003BB086AD
MARGRLLTTLLDDFRAECRLSLNPAQNAQDRQRQVRHLQRVQQWLYDDFDWPHLRVERTLRVEAGVRYYSLSDDIELERLREVQVRDASRWCICAPGIDVAQYAAYDSDEDERSWPVERWAIRENAQIELWPVPDRTSAATGFDGTLRLIGIRRLGRLVDDSDTADLDDRLIVLFAAAEALAANGAKDAGVKLDAAQRLYTKIRGDLTPRRRTKLFGGMPAGRDLRGPPRVDYRVSERIVEVPGGGGGEDVPDTITPVPGVF